MVSCRHGGARPPLKQRGTGTGGTVAGKVHPSQGTDPTRTAAGPTILGYGTSEITKGYPVEVHRKRLEGALVYDDWLLGIVQEVRLSKILVEVKATGEMRWFPLREKGRMWR